LCVCSSVPAAMSAEELDRRPFMNRCSIVDDDVPPGRRAAAQNPSVTHPATEEKVTDAASICDAFRARSAVGVPPPLPFPPLRRVWADANASLRRMCTSVVVSLHPMGCSTNRHTSISKGVAAGAGSGSLCRFLSAAEADPNSRNLLHAAPRCTAHATYGAVSS
jgi:hypothetical protein